MAVTTRSRINLPTQSRHSPKTSSLQDQVQSQDRSNAALHKRIVQHVHNITKHNLVQKAVFLPSPSLKLTPSDLKLFRLLNSYPTHPPTQIKHTSQLLHFHKKLSKSL